MSRHPTDKQPRVSPVVPLPAARPRLTRAPLPVPLTSLVGRERQVAEVRALLGRGEVRLVTLTGPGGVGKTRLALRVGEALGEEFRDGVAFVGLAQVRDPDNVVSTIARALKVREVGGQRLEDLLCSALRRRELLLVLDNLEQALGAAPRLADLLIDLPTIKILATSRELLRVSGEHGFSVPPLSLAETRTPAPATHAGHPDSAERFAASEAVRLFVTRARGVRPDFALTEENAAVVAEICRRVDGLPLGIELAAARLRHLAAESLLGRLDWRLPLLTGGPRDLPARLQTMRDAIAWSYDLLDEAEQAVFRRFSVFAGGFTLEAAEWVAGRVPCGRSPVAGTEGTPPADRRCPEGARPQTLELVASLVDKSLLQAEEVAVGQMRYAMLETIREFGLERLAESGEEEAARQRHAEWSLAFAEDAGPRAKRPGAAPWIALLEREHSNLRAALVWLVDRGDGPRLVRLAGSLWPFWQEHTYFGEGHRWLEVALELGRDAPAADRIRALTGAGTLAWYQTRVEQALAWHEEALALAREAGDRVAEAFALSNLAVQAIELGDHDRAFASLEAGLAVARAEGETEAMALALHNLACLAWIRGELATASRRAEEALALAREWGWDWLVPAILVNFGLTTADLGDPARAAALLGEGLALGHARGNLGDVGAALEGLARVGATTGQTQKATRLLGAAAALREEIAMPQPPTERAYYEPVLTALHEALGAEGFAAALAAGRSLTWQEAMAEALNLDVAPARSATPAANSRGATRHGLTGREIEILRLLAAGESNREIADRLFISPTTVARHVANLYAKLGVDSRAKAVAFAHNHGLG